MIANSSDSVVPDYESENETNSDGNRQVLQNRKWTRGVNKIYWSSNVLAKITFLKLHY